MDNPPLGVEQLLSCNELKMDAKIALFKSAYSVTAPGLGEILKISGNFDFKVKDLNGTIIATFHISQKWFQQETMTVTLYNAPILLIKMRGNFRPSVGLYEFKVAWDGTEEPQIKLKQTGVIGTNLNILANNYIIGSVKQQAWGDYTITFPQDLDVRYKVGLLAACVYERYLSQQTSSGAVLSNQC